MPIGPGTTELTTPFSKALRAATDPAHSDAEQSAFLAALLDGTLGTDGLARLAVQHLHIYRALEGAADALAGHPVAAAFVAEELRRVPSLEADLEALLGGGWRDQTDPLPSTVAYCARLEEVSRNWPGGFVAHHYTRYLGDLSGGIFIGRKLDEVLGLEGHRGTSFYVFPLIPSPSAFKEAYRAELDVAPWDDEERTRIIDEVLAAYRHNTLVLDELGETS